MINREGNEKLNGGRFILFPFIFSKVNSRVLFSYMNIKVDGLTRRGKRPIGLSPITIFPD